MRSRAPWSVLREQRLVHGAGHRKKSKVESPKSKAFSLNDGDPRQLRRRLLTFIQTLGFDMEFVQKAMEDGGEHYADTREKGETAE